MIVNIKSEGNQIDISLHQQGSRSIPAAQVNHNSFQHK